jgi:hypothetical protein
MAETGAGVLSPGVQSDAPIKERMAERRMQCPAWVRVVRSCGCVQWIVAPCSDPTCDYCQKIWADRMRERWFPVLEAMTRPKLITLTIPSGFALAERVSFEARTFRRLLDTRLGPVNWPKFKERAADFLRKHLDEYEPDVKVREERYQAGVKSLDLFGRDISRFQRSEGKWPRVRDVIGPGFSSREVTWSNEHGWHLHRHLTVDSWFIPWHLLVIVWEHAGGGPVVDIRSLGVDHKSIREALKYVTKFWTIPDDKVDEVRAALKGLKKIWPLGGAKPAEIDHLCPECKCPDCQVEEYRLGATFRKYKQGETEYMDIVLWGLFDEADTPVTLVRVNGRWRETPYLDPHGDSVPSRRARDGPDPPNGSHADSVAAYQQWLEEVWN